MNIPRSSLWTGRYCKFALITRHCSNWVAVLLYFLLTVTDCVLALSQTKAFEWLAVMVISQPPGNNPSLLSCHQRCLNCSECFQRHLMFYTCNYNIRVTHRNGAIKYIFYTNQIHGGIISRLFFIHFVAPCACSSSSVVKYYFKSSAKIWASLALHTSVGCISPECQQDRTLLRNQYY